MNGAPLLLAAALSLGGPAHLDLRVYRASGAAGAFGPDTRHSFEYTLAYDEQGALLTEPSGRTTRFAPAGEHRFAAPGRGDVFRVEGRSKVNLPSGLRLRFDPDGRFVEVGDRYFNDAALVYEDDRLSKVDLPFEQWLAFEYSTATLLVERVRASTGEVFAWDPASHTAVALPAMPVEDYKLDAMGRVVEAEGLVFTYEKDLRRPSSIRGESFGTVRLRYNDAGDWTRAEHSRSGTAEREYDTFGRLVYERDVEGPPARFRYKKAWPPVRAEDGWGRVVENRVGEDRRWTGYAVDGSQPDPGRPGAAAVPPAPPLPASRLEPGEGVVLDHDGDGRLTSRATPRGVTTFKWDEGGVVRVSDDRFGSVTFERRADGALTEMVFPNGVRQVWKPLTLGFEMSVEGPGGRYHRLRVVFDAEGRVDRRGHDGAIEAFAYRADGSLSGVAYQGKTFAARERAPEPPRGDFAYAGLDPYVERDAYGRVVREYLFGPEPGQMLGFLQEGRFYFTHLDERGNVAVITDAGGERVAAFHVGPFGEALKTRGPLEFPWAYQGNAYGHLADPGRLGWPTRLEWRRVADKLAYAKTAPPPRLLALEAGFRRVEARRRWWSRAAQRLPLLAPRALGDHSTRLGFDVPGLETVWRALRSRGID